jgi:hypothetical protein
MEDEALRTLRLVAGKGAEVESAEPFHGLGRRDPLEPDQPACPVGADRGDPDLLEGSAGAPRGELPARADAVGKVRQELDGRLAPDPVRPDDLSDGDEVLRAERTGRLRRSSR